MDKSFIFFIEHQGEAFIMKKLLIFMMLLMAVISLAACSNKEEKILINGEEKKVSKDFIKVITKNEGLAKMIIGEEEKKYDIVYEDSNYYIYDIPGNGSYARSEKKNNLYLISDEEYKLIKSFAEKKPNKNN